MQPAPIIDLEERRRARRAPVAAETAAPMWCFVWMPVYYWYLP